MREQEIRADEIREGDQIRAFRGTYAVAESDATANPDRHESVVVWVNMTPVGYGASTPVVVLR